MNGGKNPIDAVFKCFTRRIHLSIYMKTCIFFILPASKHNTTLIGAQKNTMVTPEVNRKSTMSRFILVVDPPLWI